MGAFILVRARSGGGFFINILSLVSSKNGALIIADASVLFV